MEGYRSLWKKYF